MSTPSIMPVRRDVHAQLPADRISDWHAKGRHVTHYFNALSVTFPRGERFFMDSVSHYRERVTDPELAQAVKGFIGQEAMHTREHVNYNALMDDAGLGAAGMDKLVDRLLRFIRWSTPPLWHLAVTIALEHYTAMLADGMLTHRDQIAGSEPGYEQVWVWHALEETEHKSVAFDTWNTVTKPGPLRYTVRTGAMLITTVIFWALIIGCHITLVSRDKGCKNKVRGFGDMMRFMWDRDHGAIRLLIPQWLDYFRADFHPWDHNNRAHLERIDGVVADISAANVAAA